MGMRNLEQLAQRRAALEREVAAEVQESLLWDLDRLRIDGALLVMHWGRDRVSIPLKIDPGIRLTVTREEAAPVVGSWTFDDSMMLPSREEIDAMVAEFGEEELDPGTREETIRRRSEMILAVDDGVGRMVAALEGIGALENTVFLFTSDNGALWPEICDFGNPDHDNNGPFRGYKASIYEGGHRVPFIVKWPGQVQPGSVSDQLVLARLVLGDLARVGLDDLVDDRLDR